MHSSPALYVRGPYRVVAAPPPPSDLPFRILDDAGLALRDEPTLESALAWIDVRLAALDAERAAAPLRRAR